MCQLAEPLAAAESSFCEAPREHLRLETEALVLLPQLPSAPLFSLLEFLSLAAPVVALCRSPPPHLRSCHPC